MIAGPHDLHKIAEKNVVTLFFRSQTRARTWSLLSQSQTCYHYTIRDQAPALLAL
jgi:hypothetical protein